MSKNTDDNSHENFIDYITLSISFVSLVISGFALQVSNDSKGNNAELAHVTLYLELNKRYLDLSNSLAKFHSRYDEYPVSDEEFKALLRRYWKLSFNEWYITKKYENGKYIKLWNGYYKGALSNALKKRAFLSEICHTSDNFGGNLVEFRSDLAAISGKDNFSSLCLGIEK